MAAIVSGGEKKKGHALLIPFPAQGHITPMLKLAKLLHHKGFYITFVNTEYNHDRLVRSQGPEAIAGLEDFRFETIPDGLPPSDSDHADVGGTQDIPSLALASTRTCLGPFRSLLSRLNDRDTDAPPLTCIVADSAMSFTLDAAEELRVPCVLFWTASACGFMAYMHCKDLLSRGFFPLKSTEDLTNGFLDTPVDFVAGTKNIMRMRDFPSFIRSTDPDDIMFNFLIRETSRATRASAVILNTFDDLERPVLDALSDILPPLYTVGPLHLLINQLPSDSPVVASMGSSLWKEDTSCLDWLDGKKSASVIYVNFGSIAVMTNKQLVEFAWGLANSGTEFLWVIRPDLVRGGGDDVVLPTEFLTETKERGMLGSWCAQEAVLSHRAVGGFLTHSGWNSTLESISAGVPMICWPFFAEQQTNCRYACVEWGVGREIDSEVVRREEVEVMIRELMGGTKGKGMRNEAVNLGRRAVKAVEQGGSSFQNLCSVIQEVLLQPLPKSYV